MEVTQLITLIGGTGGALSTVVVVWNLLQGPNRGLASRIDKLEGRIAKFEEDTEAIDKRLGVVEIELDQLPTKDALHELQMVVERMNSDLRVLSETMKGVKETSNLVRDYLLDEAKRVTAA